MVGITANRAGTETVSERERHAMERSAQNKLYAMNNVGELRLRYADKYIALDNGRVLAHGNTPEEVFRKLRRIGVSDMSVVAIEFIPKDRMIWLL